MKKRHAAGSCNSGSSQHSAATATRPTKTHRVDSGTSTNNGSQPWYSKTITSLLFADNGYYNEILKGHLSAIARQEPDESVNEEIKEIADEFEPDIFVAPTLIKTTNTEWQLVADDWDKACFQYIPLRKANTLLHTAYDGCMTTLHRLTPRKELQKIMKLFLVRIPKCNQKSTLFYVNQADQADIARTIFDVLTDEQAPCIVIGNLGFALASCVKFLLEFEEETGIKLRDQLQIVCSHDQELVCLFKYEEGQYIQQKIFPGDPWCLWIDIHWTGSVVSQRAAQTGGMRDTLTSRCKHYLNLLSAADNDENRRVSLVNFLLQPVVSPSSDPDATGVLDVSETLQTLDISFDLLRTARAQAGVGRDNKTLTSNEFSVAHTWLRKFFETHMITNVNLQNRIDNAFANDNTLTRRQKTKLNSDRRGAFNAWKRSLLGNKHFLMAVLRHGLFDSKSQQELLIAVLHEQSNSVDDPPAEHDRKKLRRNALNARKQFKVANKLAREMELGDLQEADLSWRQTELLNMLSSGLLEQTMIENNKAYGHGEGAKVTTTEQAAIFRMSYNSLDTNVDPC